MAHGSPGPVVFLSVWAQRTALRNSERKSKRKPAKINLSQVNFPAVGTIINAPEPTAPRAPGSHNGLWSIRLWMVKATLRDLLLGPPVILPGPETANGRDKLFYVMMHVLRSEICLLPLQPHGRMRVTSSQ